MDLHHSRDSWFHRHSSGRLGSLGTEGSAGETAREEEWEEDLLSTGEFQSI